MMKITRNGDTSYLASDQTPQSFKPVEESVNDGIENDNNNNKILADILAGKIGKKDIEYLKQCGFKVYKCIFDGSYSVGIPENYVQPFKQAGRHVYRDIFDGTYDVELE